MEKQYLIKENKMKEIYERANEIYCNLRLIELFVKENAEVDETYIIQPIISKTKAAADLLNMNLYNILFDDSF